jgi:bacterioferritin-associated ferredoxin
MYVCVCLAVTDKEVAEAIDSGADNVDAVTRACGAGGDCGSCHAMIGEMIDQRGCSGTDVLIQLKTRAA